MSTTNQPKQAPLIISKNGNGGVGKTELTAILAYLLQKRGHSCTLADCDDDHQDIYKALHKEFPVHVIKLKKDFGYSRIAQLALTPENTGPILVSAPAGDTDLFLENIAVIQAVLAAVGRATVVAWPMDKTIDSYLHLKDVIDQVGIKDVWALRNLDKGDVEEFHAFDGSKIGRSLAAAGRVLDFPVISSVIVDAFRNKRMSHTRMETEGSADLRARLPLLRKKMEAALAPFLEEYGL
ncbi:nucleotide-binding protein [Bosea sp. (in: a-proteobacteria)]